MNNVNLCANGFLIHEERQVEGEPLVFLSCRIELREGYTLRSYFRMLDRYPVLSRLNFFFPDLVSRYAASPAEGCADAGLDCLEFGKIVEMTGFPQEPSIQIYPSLKGIMGEDVFELRRFGLENILDLPLRLGGLRHIVFGDKMDVFRCDTAFNLFEFVEGIAWELSFQTGPSECRLRR